jgi:hypothetical protein
MESGKSGEIAVGCPKGLDPVVNAERRNPCVVNHRASDHSPCDEFLQLVIVPGPFSDHLAPR